MLRGGHAGRKRYDASSAFRHELYGNSDPLAKKFWRKVRPIGPCESVILKGECFEFLNVAQRAENRSHQLGGKLYFPFRAVTEAHPNHVVPDVSSFKNVKKPVVSGR